MNVTFNTGQKNLIQQNHRLRTCAKPQVGFGELNVTIDRKDITLKEFIRIAMQIENTIGQYQYEELLRSFNHKKGSVTTYRLLDPKNEGFLRAELSQIPKVHTAHTEPVYDKKGQRVITKAAELVHTGMEMVLGLFQPN